MKRSLQRLQLDYIDVLQCERYVARFLPDTDFYLPGHRFDYDTPIEETMQALHDVVQAGYARYIGMSSCYAWQCTPPSPPSTFSTYIFSFRVVHKMQNYARQHGLTEFISMQNYYNAIYREEEREMIPLLHDMGVGMIPWSPLARGFLTRPISSDKTNVRADSDTFFSLAGGKEAFLAGINGR